MERWFLSSSLVALALCVASTAAQTVEWVNTGSTVLQEETDTPCKFRLKKGYSDLYDYQSPNYPGVYSHDAVCNSTLVSPEPRYMEVRIQKLYLNFKQEELTIDSADFHFSGARGNERVLTLPSANAFIHFASAEGNAKLGRKFKMVLEVKNSDCHQAIVVTNGGVDTLSLESGYPANTICEWWIESAEPAKKVQISFTNFTLSDNCLDDNLLVDTSGDVRYNSATKYCATIPPVITSTDNRITLLLDGRIGGYPGFEATFTTV